MKWYQQKEQAAGEKRLYITWKIYKIFGKKAVKLLAIFITFFAFWGAKDARRNSKKYLEIIGIKPSLPNIFKHFLEYSYSLVDKMEVFSGNYNSKKIIFDNETDRISMENDFKNGIFFICSHLGNIDIMRALLQEYNVHVNVFLSAEQCKIFNNFIRQISIPTAITTYPVENITINTSIEIKDKLSKGEIVFMAGDRTSKNSINKDIKFFDKKIQIPLGTFKFAKLMDCPIYYVCALRENNTYRIYMKKLVSLPTTSLNINKMQQEYADFLEKHTLLAPYQFFHFYDLFE